MSRWSGVNGVQACSARWAVELGGGCGLGWATLPSGIVILCRSLVLHFFQKRKLNKGMKLKYVYLMLRDTAQKLQMGRTEENKDHFDLGVLTLRLQVHGTRTKEVKIKQTMERSTAKQTKRLLLGSELSGH